MVLRHQTHGLFTSENGRIVSIPEVGGLHGGRTFWILNFRNSVCRVNFHRDGLFVTADSFAFATAIAPPFLRARQVGVEHGSQVERHQLREEQSSDDNHAQRLTGFASGAVADGDRNSAQ